MRYALLTVALLICFVCWLNRPKPTTELKAEDMRYIIERFHSYGIVAGKIKEDSITVGTIKNETVADFLSKEKP